LVDDDGQSEISLIKNFEIINTLEELFFFHNMTSFFFELYGISEDK